MHPEATCCIKLDPILRPTTDLPSCTYSTRDASTAQYFTCEAYLHYGVILTKHYPFLPSLKPCPKAKNKRKRPYLHPDLPTYADVNLASLPSSHQHSQPFVFLCSEARDGNCRDAFSWPAKTFFPFLRWTSGNLGSGAHNATKGRRNTEESTTPVSN